SDKGGRVMRARMRIVLFAASVSLVALPSRSIGGELHPPATKADGVKDTFGSVEVRDPYRWLEDQKAPETRAWIDEQNRYSETFLHALSGRDALKKRITELLKVDTTQTPTEKGGLYFFNKRLADQDLSVLYVRKGVNGKDEVLLDPHPLSPDHTVSIALLD